MLPNEVNLKLNKKKDLPANRQVFFLFFKPNIYASALISFTETNERSSFPLWNVTIPSTKAYKV